MARLLRDLEDERLRGVCVYDDGSRPAARPPGVEVVRLRHGGRRGYWGVMHRIMQDARRDPAWSRLLILPDDVRIIGGDFLVALESLWQAIDDERKLVLNPLVDARGHLRQWTPLEPVSVLPGLVRVGWNDGCLYTDRDFVNVFPGFHRPPESRWAETCKAGPGLQSSGVGWQLSAWAYRRGYSLWQVEHTLLHHGDHRSMMHPGRSYAL